MARPSGRWPGARTELQSDHLAWAGAAQPHTEQPHIGNRSTSAVTFKQAALGHVFSTNFNLRLETHWMTMYDLSSKLFCISFPCLVQFCGVILDRCIIQSVKRRCLGRIPRALLLFKIVSLQRSAEVAILAPALRSHSPLSACWCGTFSALATFTGLDHMSQHCLQFVSCQLTLCLVCQLAMSTLCTFFQWTNPIVFILPVSS